MSDIPDNNRYWLNRDGEGYRLQQAIRRGRNDVDLTEYHFQEDFLRDVVSGRIESKPDKVLRVLDYGCGFGRLAPILLEQKQVSYTGFDFSESMAGTFRDAAVEFNEAERLSVKIAPDLDAAVGDAKFDLIFVVAVLMHNDPEQARKMYLSMRAHLAPDGLIVLVENPMATGSSLGNYWHGGCWTHDVARDLAPEMNVRVYADAIPNQAAYMLSEVRDGTRRIVERVAADGSTLELDNASLDAIGQGVTATSVATLAHERNLSPLEVAEYHDLQEIFKSLSNDLLEALHKEGIAEGVTELTPWEVYNALRSVLRRGSDAEK